MARSLTRAGLLLVCATLLTACGLDKVTRMGWWTGEPEERPSPRLVGATQYECDDNRRLAIRFGAAGQPAMAIFPEREFRLDPVAGSPGRYTNGRGTLMVQGGTASYEEPGPTPATNISLTNCKIPAPAKK